MQHVGLHWGNERESIDKLPAGMSGCYISHRALEVITLSWILLIFCPASPLGPCIHSVPCCPNESTAWSSHWTQTWGLALGYA